MTGCYRNISHMAYKFSQLEVELAERALSIWTVLGLAEMTAYWGHACEVKGQKMKKVTKAAIAAGAAGALMLGGAGTLALWTDDTNVDAGSVSTGHLTMETAGAGVWADASVGAANTAFNPATDHLVPGDKVTYKQNVTIGADGKNLKGTLTETGLTGGSVLPTDVDVALTVDRNVVGVSQDAGTGVITFGAAAQYTVPVTVTITFAQTAEGDMDALLDLGALTLTLNQVR